MLTQLAHVRETRALKEPFPLLEVLKTVVVDFGEVALAAFLMNLAWFIQVHSLYYEATWNSAMGFFDAQVGIIFGQCVMGFGPECTQWHS